MPAAPCFISLNLSLTWLSNNNFRFKKTEIQRYRFRVITGKLQSSRGSKEQWFWVSLLGLNPSFGISYIILGQVTGNSNTHLIDFSRELNEGKNKWNYSPLKIIKIIFLGVWFKYFAVLPLIFNHWDFWTHQPPVVWAVPTGEQNGSTISDIHVVAIGYGAGAYILHMECNHWTSGQESELS